MNNSKSQLIKTLELSIIYFLKRKNNLEKKLLLKLISLELNHHQLLNFDQ